MRVNDSKDKEFLKSQNYEEKEPMHEIEIAVCIATRNVLGTRKCH